MDGHSARRDFLTYALSLMRSHNDEHLDNLPVMDISSLKHVAYVLDALIYYMRSGTDPDSEIMRDGASVHSWQDPDDNNEDADDDTVNQSVAMETDSVDGEESDIGGRSGRKHPFFQRSDSMSILGCPPPDPFQTSLVESVPLADQPHLLQPNARREDMFGMPRRPVSSGSLDTGSLQPSPFDRLPTHMALSMRTAGTSLPTAPGAMLHPYAPVAMDVPSTATPVPTQQNPTESNLAMPGNHGASVMVPETPPPPPSMTAVANNSQHVTTNTEPATLDLSQSPGLRTERVNSQENQPQSNSIIQQQPPVSPSGHADIAMDSPVQNRESPSLQNYSSGNIPPGNSSAGISSTEGMGEIVGIASPQATSATNFDSSSLLQIPFPPMPSDRYAAATNEPEPHSYSSQPELVYTSSTTAVNQSELVSTGGGGTTSVIVKPGTSGISTSVVTSLSTVVTPSVSRSYYSMDNPGVSSSIMPQQDTALELTTSSTNVGGSPSTEDSSVHHVQQPKPPVSQPSVIVHSSSAPVVIPTTSNESNVAQPPTSSHGSSRDGGEALGELEKSYPNDHDQRDEDTEEEGTEGRQSPMATTMPRQEEREDDDDMASVGDNGGQSDRNKTTEQAAHE